jgi:hypothetical protein
MTRQIVFTQRAGKPPATYSQAVKAAGLVLYLGHHLLPRAPSSAAPFRNRPASV